MTSSLTPGATVSVDTVVACGVAAEVLAVLAGRRRPFVDHDLASDGCDGDSVPLQLRAHPQWIRILDFVLSGEPVEFTLPAFPCKSPNPAKVAGHLPDEGELLALHELQALCTDIAAVYPPGARVILCSDGHVFSDVIGVPDAWVDEYGIELRRLVYEEGLTHISVFDLRDMWLDESLDVKRDKLVHGWMESVADLRRQARQGGEVARMLRGMTRFLLEDAVEVSGTPSQRQREAKRRAYQVLGRSRAWGALVAHHMPRAVRLSIHPQPWGSAKFGIALVRSGGTETGWATPWHSVVLLTADGPRLMPRRDVPPHARAETRRGRVWCFVAE